MRWEAAHSIASPQQEGGKRDIVRERARSERGACATATRATATAMRTTATATTTSATSTATQATDEATATTALAATATATSTTVTATATEAPAAECDSVGEDKRTSAMARGTTATVALAATAMSQVVVAFLIGHFGPIFPFDFGIPWPELNSRPSFSRQKGVIVQQLGYASCRRQ